MQPKDRLTRSLAVVGTALTWFPILAPVGFSAARMIRGGRFLFDYLMPAELFPAALLGGALLIWAALRAHAHLRLIGLGLAVAVALLAGGQALAVVTGLASGAVGPGGWQMAVVLASLAGYVLALIAIGVGGALLLRDLFRAPRQPV